VSPVEVRLLGPVELWGAAGQVPLGPPQRRGVLAVLALAVGRPVLTETLVDRVWGEAAPDRPRDLLYAHLSRLRRCLRQAGGDDPATIRRAAGGYLLSAPSDTVDLHRARALVTRARACRDDDPHALALLRQAGELWRGVPLMGLTGDWAERMRHVLTQERLSVMAERFRRELQLGRHASAVDPLSTLLAEHPVAEPVAALLMLALHRSGRRADALRVYARLRQRLADELGTEPGPPLRTLHEQLLRDGPDPTGRPEPGEPPAPVPAVPPVPAQLPPAVAAFTGRRAELSTLDGWLPALAGRDRAGGDGACGDGAGGDGAGGDDAGGDDAGPAVPIAVITGPPGVGKTALAVHWAQQVRHRFPDGQLYANLRGYDPDRPTPPAEALAQLLAALEVAGADVPPGLDDRAARYRSELAERRMLIVLDNAAAAAQVRPLLPGGGANAVVVTSRDSLAGLVAVHGARRLELDLLPHDEAVTLLRRLLGTRVDADPGAATTLADQCGRLPLALRIAAELALSRPGAPLAELVAELADLRSRLDLLDSGGDPYAAVRSVFSWSTRQLDSDTARLFRLLGLHPGVDIEPYAAAALAGTGPDAARRSLAMLARAHLLHPTGHGRYGMHDLLRGYAVELAGAHDTERTRQAALTRLWDHYRHTTAVAMDLAYPYERDVRPRVPPAAAPTPDLAGPAGGTGWLDAELPNLLAAAWRAGEDGWPEHLVHLSALLHRHLRTRGRYGDAEALHDRALTTTRATGDRAGEMDALNGLGYVHLLRGHYRQATDHYRQALEVARGTGHRAGEVGALRGLGGIHQVQGRYPQAIASYEEALEIARAAGHLAGALDVLTGLGDMYRERHRYQRAADAYREALEIARGTGHRSGELNALACLGDLHRLQGDAEQALDQLGQAWEMARATGYRAGEVRALIGLGATHRLQGRLDRALGDYQRALDIAREVNDRNWQFEARSGLGRVHQAAGQPHSALAEFDLALMLATDLAQPADQARAHDGLAHAHHALCHPEAARRHWRQAIAILDGLGVGGVEDEGADAAAIRAHLATLDAADHPAARPPPDSGSGPGTGNSP
jgi:DNA-binding SARP family transcriptional activator/Tfp pilus assembly protein PilF